MIERNVHVIDRQDAMEANNNHDGDWISRRWQGEGNVVAPESPQRAQDPEKTARIAQQQEHTDLSGNVGRHCNYCKTLDYLPTKCDGCGKFHCHEHAEAANHECSGKKGPVVDRRALTCMLCNHAIHGF